MWLYFLVLRALRRVGFEMELIAFFLCTLSLSVTASSAPHALFKQLIAMVLGLVLFLVLGVFLRDLERVKKIRWLMAVGAICLLGLSLVAGQVKYGAANWISIGGISFQPSEVAKICYIFAGAATLERLFRKRNLGLFILLTGVCMGCLALMSDFGTAAIFFITFLVIAYLRSGDWTTLALICGAAVFGGFMLLSVKPYILRRFATWGHAWQYASEGGFQQTRTMSAAASGGLVGGGPGRGWLYRVPAADTDLVFGMLCEEWAHHRGAGGVLHSDVGAVCCPGLPGGAVQLLCDCRLRGHVHDGLSDGAECAGRGGYPASDRRDLSVCLQRRLVHALFVGASGLSEGHRHPTERQLCHSASQPEECGGTGPAGTPEPGGDAGFP